MQPQIQDALRHESLLNIKMAGDLVKIVSLSVNRDNLPFKVPGERIFAGSWMDQVKLQLRRAGFEPKFVQVPYTRIYEIWIIDIH